MAILIDGKALAAKVKDEVAEDAALLRERGIVPCLTVILVGEDSGSQIYVRNKKKACEENGIASRSFELPENTSESRILELVSELNADPTVDGILIQQPLPKHLDPVRLMESVDPKKDVDCLTYDSCGRLMSGRPYFLPCTPAGIMRMLLEYNISVSGKNCVVVGRSGIVGRPMAMMLLWQNGTVTVCHSKTKDLAAECRRADILIVATGKRDLVTADMVKDGCVVIDVGMNRDENGKLHGDVDFVNVEKKAYAITPVPGGVGPMTIAMLLKNTISAAKMRSEQKKQ
ncbi:MAG TPA: bifunctional methylenetetrahydrofolate dehydrogenase/methenyltetrahydrofolate cyclohydrolase FolD [Oscillospiraceae bacterium]|nr:bifunctional methylenetetrahydrofolate dehydrogenase/methenyltetrahydrofolate cyclohydrolase FolD [Oscillospiraceae bacterium]HPS33661.1 bifunctional methylenetetrahydrofolate dehydrogenase/methenyltetrahydrofolate cyclohydrolase FolD [Oscillospiraceae bacterium]